MTTRTHTPSATTTPTRRRTPWRRATAWLATALAGALLVAPLAGAQSASDFQGAPTIDLSSTDGATITEAGAYVLTGSLSNGSVVVRAPGAAVTLVLDGVDIANSSGPAILFEDVAEAAVVLAEGSSNVLTDGGASELDAALYSAASLTIAGGGALEVHATYEGISSTMHITIAGGTLRVYAEEDGINANNDGVSQIAVTGGYLYVETETGDAIDSNGTITVSGGTVIAVGAMADGNSGLDADGAVTITGGTVIATGGSMMGSLATSDQQAVVVSYQGTQAAGTLAVLRDAAGADVLAFAPARAYQQLLYSSADLTAGATYTVYAGGVGSGEAVDGLFQAVSDPGTEVGTVTAGSGQGGRGPGGMGPGGFPGGAPGAPGAPGGRTRP